MIYMGVIGDNGTFKVTWGLIDVGGGETSLKSTSRQIMTLWLEG